jgi:photosynthetic reaction center cytochrome c subunit
MASVTCAQFTFGQGSERDRNSATSMPQPERTASTVSSRLREDLIRTMSRALNSARGAVFVLSVILTSFLMAHAQGGPNMDGKKAEEVYKNIQVLKGTPASELNQAMHLIEGATGMDCTVCHVEGAFDKDDKPAKTMARMMMQMVIDLNNTRFNGRQVITCYTCHNGHPRPLDAPMLPTAKPALPQGGAKPALPTVDEILSKYVDALGGQQAIRKVTSRIVTGTQYIPTGPGGGVPVPALVERYQKAPNLAVDTYHTATYTISDGFDGSKAWAQNAQGRVSEPLAIDQDRAKRDSDFYLPLDLKQEYPKLEVQGIERVDGRDAYRVVGTPEGDLPERLYFDTQSGLLLRKATALPTPVGNSPFQVDYSDYRDTGSGVKFPYTITTTPANPRTVLYGTAVFQVTKVEDNKPIEDAKFDRPASKSATAGREARGGR